MPTSELGVPTYFPTYAIYRGRKVRITGYEGPDDFKILLPDDTQTFVKRSKLIFPKRGK